MGKKASFVLFIVLLLVMLYPMFFENIEKGYLSHIYDMPISEIYGDIYSVIYESESDNTITWIIYAKKKNKKLDHTYLVHEIDKDFLNKMTSKYMKKYDYEDVEKLNAGPFLNERINDLDMNELDEKSLKRHLFFRVSLRFGERDNKSIEYSIFGDESFIKDY